MPKLVLATSSKLRINAFQNLGLPFETQASNINEKDPNRPDNPEDLVLHLATQKAKNVAATLDEGFVIGFDSVGWNGEIMEKPASREEAESRLANLSGKNHELFTGVNLQNIHDQKETSAIANTIITFRKITAAEIRKYLDQDDAYKKIALGYNPCSQYSLSFIKKIRGSYNNFLSGLPLEVITENLPKIGYNLAD